MKGNIEWVNHKKLWSVPNTQVREMMEWKKLGTGETCVREEAQWLQNSENLNQYWWYWSSWHLLKYQQPRYVIIGVIAGVAGKLLKILNQEKSRKLWHFCVVTTPNTVPEFNLLWSPLFIHPSIHSFLNNIYWVCITYLLLIVLVNFPVVGIKYSQKQLMYGNISARSLRIQSITGRKAQWSE